MHVKGFVSSVLLVVTVLIASSASATAIGPTAIPSGATLINFDTDEANQTITGGTCMFGNCGDVISNQYASQGITFSVGAGFTVNANAEHTPYLTGSSAPNVAFVNQGTGSTPLQIDFSVPVNVVGFRFGTPTDSYLQLEVFDTSDTLLESLSFVGYADTYGGWHNFAGALESTNVGKVEVSSHPLAGPPQNKSFAIDNVQFAIVPEPASVLLLVVGLFGFLCASRRRRKQNN